MRSQAKTLLFMSADIVGSTAYKEASRPDDGERPGWLGPFEAFFRELPLVLIGQAAIVFEDADDLPEVGVWRVSGDEIIFLARPRSADDAARLLAAFHRAVRRYDQRLGQGWGLALRGCCWGARFPGRNVEIEIPEMATAGRAGGMTYFEYLGPEVDAGFRVASRAAAGEVVVTLNVVEALAPLAERHHLRFRALGSAVLKGVHSGQPYPLIALGQGEGGSEGGMSPHEIRELWREVQAQLDRAGGLGLSALVF